MKWEYNICTAPSDEYPHERLNALGADGWELVCVEAYKDNGVSWRAYHFKRPLPQEPGT